MNPRDLLQETDHMVQALLPEQHRPVQKALAAVLCGLVGAQSAVLSRLALHMPGFATPASKQRQAQRLLANEHVDLPRAQRRLLTHVLHARRGRIDLVLDAVVRGASAQQAGTVTLVLGVAWHRRALPLVWRSWPADQPGQHWRAAIREMVLAVQAALPADAQVVLLVDRGLSGSPLAHLVLEMGTDWHFLWRVEKTTRVYLPADGSVHLLTDLVPRPGTRAVLDHVQVYAPRHKVRAGAGGWESDWDAALTASVVAIWRQTDVEPWLLVTDLPTSQARCAEYRRRTWEEELFRDLKSLGWQWQKSRVLQPERVQRLLLVLALATLWMVSLGERVLRRGQRRQLESGRRRRLSVFQLGYRWCAAQLAAHRLIPCDLRLGIVARAPVKLS